MKVRQEWVCAFSSGTGDVRFFWDNDGLWIAQDDSRILIPSEFVKKFINTLIRFENTEK